MKMKTALLLLACALVCQAEEIQRQWTNRDGKIIVATLKGKTSATCDLVLNNGNKVTMEISSLSEADRKYIAQADVAPDPIMHVEQTSVKAPLFEEKRINGKSKKTEKVKKRNEERTVEVTLSDINNRHFMAHIVWLKAGPSVMFQDKKEVHQDGKITFTHSFPSSCVGYAVGLKEISAKDKKEGTRWIVTYGSDVSYVKFLGNK